MQWKAEIDSVQSSCWNSIFFVFVQVVAEKGEDVLRMHEVSNVAQQVLPILKKVKIERQLHMVCSCLFVASESELVQSVCQVSESMAIVLCEVIKKDQIIQHFYFQRQKHEDVWI